MERQAVADAGLPERPVVAAGDQGVRSVQTFTSSVSMTSGVVHLVAFRVLARVSVPLAATEYAVDALTAGMPKLHDNTVPFLLWDELVKKVVIEPNEPAPPVETKEAGK